MDILVQATIKAQGDAGALTLEDEHDNGHYRITYIGDEVTIAAMLPRQRARRVDRLVEATRVVLDEGKWAIEGTSTKLIETVGVPPDNARVSFQAQGQDGCPTCH